MLFCLIKAFDLCKIFFSTVIVFLVYTRAQIITKRTIGLDSREAFLSACLHYHAHVKAIWWYSNLGSFNLDNDVRRVETSNNVAFNISWGLRNLLYHTADYVILKFSVITVEHPCSDQPKCEALWPLTGGGRFQDESSEHIDHIRSNFAPLAYDKCRYVPHV